MMQAFFIVALHRFGHLWDHRHTETVLKWSHTAQMEESHASMVISAICPSPTRGKMLIMIRNV
jgi:hypothetical protein